MSKASLKKYLSSLDKDQLLQVILDLYDARKDAREYLEFFLNPDSESAYEKARESLYKNYFNSKGKPVSRMNLKEGNEIVKNFIKLETDPEFTGKLLLIHAQYLEARLIIKGSVSETAWNSVVSAFRKAVSFLASYRIIDLYQKQVDTIFNNTRFTPAYLRIEERLRQEYDEAVELMNNTQS